MLAVIVFAIGASVGSFLNVVADRLPEGQSLVRPRSRCSSCKRPISNADMVQVFSYLWLRGRCRHCGASIPPRTMVVELTSAILFTVVYLRFDFGVEFVLIAAGVSLLLVVAVIDLEHKLVLDFITLPSMVVALLLAPFWTELGFPRTFLGHSTMLASLANSVVAGLGGFTLLLVVAIAKPGGMGFGDVKLAGLLGLLVGYPGIAVALWGGIVVGGVVAIVLLALRVKGRKDVIPFAPYLSLGGVAVLLFGSDIVSGYQQLIDSMSGL